MESSIILAPLAQNETRTFFEMVPVLPVHQWWHWALVLGAVASIVWLIFNIYRKDNHALPRSVAVTLLSLRLASIVGLIFFFVGLEKRSESRIIKPSRLIILIDNSLSMELSDDPADDGSRTSRMEHARAIVGESGLLQRLQNQHDVQLYRFGDSEVPELIGRSSRIKSTSATVPPEPLLVDQPVPTSSIWLAIVGLAMLAFGGLSFLITVPIKMRRPQRGSSGVVATCWALVLGILTLAISDLVSSDHSIGTSLGIQQPAESTSIQNNLRGRNRPSATDRENETQSLDDIDLTQQLSATGVSTRLGSALNFVVEKNRASALAGIILVTDGQSNQGLPPSQALTAIRDSNIPVYAIGVGSNRRPANIRVSEVQAPATVIPGDKFFVSGILQSTGMAGKTVPVRLLWTDADRPGQLQQIERRTIRLPDDSEPLTIKFELTGDLEQRRRYIVQVDSLPEDSDHSDNQQMVDVNIVQRKTTVLLMAGGPGRDYRFLRNQLYRDETINLDVLLQNADPGADQESDNLLFEFPNSAPDLDKYDCVVAFDPDWRKLSIAQATLLERWVSEKAGGLVVIAGPVFTPEWTRRPSGETVIDLIRALYPVSFYSRGSAVLKLGRFGGKQPFPLEFTRQGKAARHLWLGAEAAQGKIANWDDFAGVYGYYAVNEPKAGAEILARFSDPATKIEGQLPIYLASQYYGAGRVFFQASAEVWRLRTLDVRYFQNYYLNQIRWSSQGRLLRESNQGVLLVDRNRCWVGDQIQVRAILRDASDRPLEQNQIVASLRQPDGSSQSLTLNNRRDPASPGTFVGQFVASSQGQTRVSLPVPFKPDSPPLRAQVSAAIPDLEKIQPIRNDALLQEIADQSGGLYFRDVRPDGSATFQSRTESTVVEKRIALAHQDGLASMIGAVDQVSYLPGVPDERFATKLSRWLLGWLVLVLSTEWIVRRLHKLA